MRRWKKGFCMVLLLSLTGLFAGCNLGEDQSVSNQARETIKNIQDAAQDLASTEPREVRELREKEVKEKDGEWTEYFFQQLTQEQQRIYREIQEGVQEYQPEIYVSSADNAAIDLTYHALLRDHPELFWIHNREATYKTVHSSYTVFEPGYQVKQEEIPGVKESMELAYQQVAQSLDADADDYDKAKAAYEYVILNTEYAYSEDDQSIAGVFRDHQAVCAGYAGAVQYLLERMGVECLYVTGDFQESPDGHAWNIVNLDGDYYYLDATNGDQPDFLQGDGVAVDSNMVLYDYLCPFPEEYESLGDTHTEFSVPDCKAVADNYYVRSGSYFESYDRESIYQYACGQIDQGEKMIRIKFADQQGYTQAVSDLIDEKMVERIAQYYMNSQGLQQIEYRYGSLEHFQTLYFML